MNESWNKGTREKVHLFDKTLNSQILTRELFLSPYSMQKQSAL